MKEQFEAWQISELRRVYPNSTPAGWTDEEIRGAFLQFDGVTGAYRGQTCQAEYAAYLAGHAAAQEEAARLRAALDAVYELAHDPAILTICREATQ